MRQGKKAVQLRDARITQYTSKTAVGNCDATKTNEVGKNAVLNNFFWLETALSGSDFLTNTFFRLYVTQLPDCCCFCALFAISWSLS